jgi:hypothetical protein
MKNKIKNKWGFPETDKYIIQFNDRMIFNFILSWDLKAICKKSENEPEIGYSDMIIIWFDLKDKEYFKENLLMNNIKNYKEIS